MRLTFAGYAAASVALTAGVIANAYVHEPQFYLACVYLVKSNGSLMVLYNAMLLLIIIAARILQKIFLGPLRPTEIEHAYERLWYTITEALLAMTMFRDEFNTRFLALFTILLVVKLFHWLASDRVDVMEQSPAIQVKFHVRMVALVALLAATDVFFVNYTAEYTIAHGVSMLVMFGFEYAVQFASLVGTAVKYVLHTIDLRDENPWENKSMYIFYLELVIDLVKLLLYLGFIYVILKAYGLPLHIIRDLYFTFRSFATRLADMVQYRRATYNMNERYADATEAELAATDRTCIICREDMETGKKLPCGHIFHMHCLRTWLERQQTCPTCRTSVLVAQPRGGAAAPRAAGNGPARPIARNIAGVAPGPGRIGSPLGAAMQRSAGAAASTAAQQQSAADVLNALSGQHLPPGPLLLMPLVGYTPPAPGDTPLPGALPAPLDQIPLEQLRRMEGHERAAVEERLRFLMQVQAQVSGLIVALSQFQRLSETLPAPSTPAAAAAAASGSAVPASAAVAAGSGPGGSASRPNDN